MKYTLSILLLLSSYISLGQGVKFPFGGTRPIDTAYAARSLTVDSNLKLTKYRTSDTNAVLGFDANGNGILREKGTGGSTISGTQNKIPYFNTTSTIGNSNIYDSVAANHSGVNDTFSINSIVYVKNTPNAANADSILVKGSSKGTIRVAPQPTALAPLYHSWPANIDSLGNIPVSKLNSGTGASSSTFWRGDGTWSAAGTGSVTSVTATSGGGITFNVTNPTTTPVITATVTTNANLTGDVTSIGNATTLATVNSNVGSFGVASATPTYTVNAKGLITASSNTPISILASQVSNLTSQSYTLTGTWAWSQNAIGTTTTPAISLTNTTTATSGVPIQYSPAIYFLSAGRSITSGSETSEWWIESTPNTATGDITGGISFMHSLAGGAKTTAFEVFSNGNYSSSGIGSFGNIEIGGFNGSANPNIISSTGTLGMNLQTFQGNIFIQCPGGTVSGITSVRPRANFNQQFTFGLQVFSPLSESSVDSFTALQITNVETSLGSGRQLLIDFNAGTTGTTEVMNITNKGIFGYYNGVKTVGIGVPAIYGMGNVTAQTTATTVATYTPASTGLFIIDGCVNITAISLDVIQFQCTYTDENSASQTLVFYPMGLTTPGLSTTGNTSYAGASIRALGGTAITISTVLTTGTGSITYDAFGRIAQE